MKDRFVDIPCYNDSVALIDPFLKFFTEILFEGLTGISIIVLEL